ncbi:hypothetical protein ACHAWF_007445 [Thalassiosira exigua]
MTAATAPSLPAGGNASLGSGDGPSPSSSAPFCPPFPTDAALDAYLASIAPPRELVCPITQDLLRDPVVAEDGHTYERSSLEIWFGMGRTRSPVTNALLERPSEEGLASNLAVAGMARAHRERLGRALVDICQGVRERRGRCDGGGVAARVEGLLDAGADASGRGDGGNSPLHLLIQSGNVRLASRLLDHDASVLLANDAGRDCIAEAERECDARRDGRGRSSDDGASTSAEWSDFVRELKRREASERARAEARDRARSRANEESVSRLSSLLSSPLVRSSFGRRRRRNVA